jgi:succinoglycan biosynthesis protein ExoM
MDPAMPGDGRGSATESGKASAALAPGALSAIEGAQERIDVCICTFRRASVAETMESVAAQALPERARVRIIVADNDEGPNARELVLAAADQLGVEIRYVHAPCANISIARNACLAASDSDWLAFIDDDEVAARDWLAKLLAAREGADVVFGPAISIYSAAAPAWMARGNYHGHVPRAPDAVGAPHTANVLIRRACIGGERFDPALGRAGGEDTVFFHALRLRGARFAAALDARVFERVVAPREKVGWIVRRKYRAGQTHAHLIARFHRGRLALTIGLAALKVIYSAAAALATAPFPAERMRNVFRAIFHSGVVAYGLGGRFYQEYRTPSAPASQP